MAAEDEVTYIVKEITLVIAAPPGNTNPTAGFIMEWFDRGCNRARNAHIGYVVCDGETGRRERRVEFGESPPAVKAVMDLEFGPEDPEAIGA